MISSLGGDVSTAMLILGFPSNQTLENTSEDQIGKIFLSRMRSILKRRNSMNNQEEVKDKDWQNQVILLFEALQTLKKKKEISTKLCSESERDANVSNEKINKAESNFDQEESIEFGSNASINR